MRKPNLRKRAFDIAAGTVLSIAALPLVVVMAIGVAVTLRAWPFFVHERVGRKGKSFRFLKLRTLPPSVPRYADKYTLQHFKTSRLAEALRRHHLDELPQLFLVPLGTMSLVGPRPEMPQLHAEGDPLFANVRTSVRPGCTGLWQIGREAEHLIWEAPAYDLYYLANQSFGLDMWILWRSILLIAGLGRPVALSAVPRRFRQMRFATAAVQTQVWPQVDTAAGEPASRHESPRS